MQLRLVLLGFVFWALATALLRLAGQRILPTHPGLRIVILFAASFAVMAILIRRVCQRARLDRDQWPMAAVSLLLPTVLLDPFSSAFFPIVFPNVAPQAAGVFGGWMIVCCAGGLVGSVIRR